MKKICATAWTWTALAVFLVAGMVISGCAGAWGSLKINPELALGLENAALNPDYAYYYCGRSGLPYAVVGIDKAYTFEGRFWFKIDDMAEVYKKIDHLADLEAGQTIRYTKDILAKDGRVVGVYFSYYFATPVSVDEGTKQITVINPYKPSSHLNNGF